MVQYKDFLWQNQYFETVAGRFAIPRNENILSKDNDNGSLSGVYQDLHDVMRYDYDQIATSGLNPSGQYEFYNIPSGYVTYQKRKHIDGPRVEKLMWWLDNIAVAHKMYNSNYIPSGINVSSGGFGWQVFNGIEYTNFAPTENGSGLIGYPWADKNMWKQIRGAISHVCKNVNIVPPHDIGDYTGESLFTTRTVSQPSGVWDSRWFYTNNHPSLGLGLWVPPTDDEDWSKSIPSGNHAAEGYSIDYSLNNYGVIGQYGKLYSEEYDQYFPSSSGNVLLAGLQWGMILKAGSYNSANYRQYARVVGPEQQLKSLWQYVNWGRSSGSNAVTAKYDYNIKVHTNSLTVYNYDEPYSTSYSYTYTTPRIYSDGYFMEPPNGWVFDTARLTASHFRFVYETSSVYPKYYFKNQNTPLYYEVGLTRTFSPGLQVAYNDGANWYWNPSIEKPNPVPAAWNPIACTFVDIDISNHIFPEYSTYRFSNDLNTGYSQLFGTNSANGDVNDIMLFSRPSEGVVSTRYENQYAWMNGQGGTIKFLVGPTAFSLNTTPTISKNFTGNYIIDGQPTISPSWGYDGSAWTVSNYYDAEFTTIAATDIPGYAAQRAALMVNRTTVINTFKGEQLPNYWSYDFFTDATTTIITEKYALEKNARNLVHAKTVPGPKVLIANPYPMVHPNSTAYLNAQALDAATGSNTIAELQGKYYENQGYSFADPVAITGYAPSEREDWYIDDDLDGLEEEMLNGIQSVYNNTKWSVSTTFNLGSAYLTSWLKNSTLYKTYVTSNLTQRPYFSNGGPNSSLDLISYNPYSTEPNYTNYANLTGGVTNGVSDYWYTDVSGEYHFMQHAMVGITYVGQSSLRNKFGIKNNDGLTLRGSFGMLGNLDKQRTWINSFTNPVYATCTPMYTGKRKSIDFTRTYLEDDNSDRWNGNLTIKYGWIDAGSGNGVNNANPGNPFLYDDIMSENGTTHNALYSYSGNPYIMSSGGTITPSDIQSFEINMESIVDALPPSGNSIFYLIYQIEPKTLTFPEVKPFWRLSQLSSEDTFSYCEGGHGCNAAIATLGSVTQTATTITQSIGTSILNPNGYKMFFNVPSTTTKKIFGAYTANQSAIANINVDGFDYNNTGTYYGKIWSGSAQYTFGGPYYFVVGQPTVKQLSIEIDTDLYKI